MLTPKQITILQEELQTAKNPLFLHDDDADGLCSFLLLYRIHREGKEFIFKNAPKLDGKFVTRVLDRNPDKIFILDVPVVEQEFVDGVKKPIFWIDHHPPLDLKKVNYYNPRLQDPEAYVPTSRMAWQVSQKPEDLWIAVAGCLADYYLPEFLDEFIEQFPEWITEKGDLPHIIFNQPIKMLVRFFFFILKGSSAEVWKSTKILTRIKSPDEIFKQETAQGKFLYKRFEKINQMYEELLEKAKQQAHSGKLFIFNSTEDQWSFTANLANELSALYPQKIILIVRKKSGEMKCSLRGRTRVLEPLQRALVGISGYGGGHPLACGAVIKEESWDQFLINLQEEFKK